MHINKSFILITTVHLDCLDCYRMEMRITRGEIEISLGKHAHKYSFTRAIFQRFIKLTLECWRVSEPTNLQAA